MFFPVPPPQVSESGPPPESARPRPLGVRLALAANAIVLCAGAILLLAQTGTLSPGPVVAVILLNWIAVGIDLLAGFVSLLELLGAGRRWAGLAGAVLCLTALFFSYALGEYLILIWPQ